MKGPFNKSLYCVEWRYRKTRHRQLHQLWAPTLSLGSSHFRFLQAKRGKRARALGKKEQKSRSGGRGGEGKETPAAEPRHFTERPQMASLPWGLHCHVKCHMRTNQFLITYLSENRIAAGNLFT